MAVPQQYASIILAAVPQQYHSRRSDATAVPFSSQCHISTIPDASPQQQYHSFPTYVVMPQQWALEFKALADWFKETGQTQPRQHVECAQERQLAEWINHQRVAYFQGSMKADRVEMFNAMPGWSWSPRADQWEEWYEMAEVWFYHPPWSRENPRTCYPRERKLVGVLEEEANPEAAVFDDGVDDDTHMFLVQASQLRRWMGRQISSAEVLETSRAQKLNELPEWVWPCRLERLQAEPLWQMMLDKYVSWAGHRFNATASSEPFTEGGTKYERALGQWFHYNVLHLSASMRSKTMLGIVPLPLSRFEKFMRAFRRPGQVSAHFHPQEGCDAEFLARAREELYRIDIEILAKVPRHSYAEYYELSPVGCHSCVPALYSPLNGTLLGAWEASPGLRVHHNFLGWELPLRPEWFRWSGQWNASKPRSDSGNRSNTAKCGETPLTDGGLPALNSALYAASALHGTRISQLMHSGAQRILRAEPSTSGTWPYPYVAKALRECASVAGVHMHPVTAESWSPWGCDLPTLSRDFKAGHGCAVASPWADVASALALTDPFRAFRVGHRKHHVAGFLLRVPYRLGMSQGCHKGRGPCLIWDGRTASPGQWVALLPLRVLPDDPCPAHVSAIHGQARLPLQPLLPTSTCPGYALLCDPHHETPFVLGAAETADLLHACSSSSTANVASGYHEHHCTGALALARPSPLNYDTEIDTVDHACFVLGVEAENCLTSTHLNF